MTSFRTIEDLGDLAGKRVLVRLDLNVPVENGKVTDATRIERSLGTINELMDRGAIPVLISHFGRPKGKFVPDMSLEVVVPALEKALGRPIIFVPDDGRRRLPEHLEGLKPGNIVLADNVRFYQGEEQNAPDFAVELARGMDAYVDDAFSCAHRAHASTEGVAHVLPSAAGRAMQAELDALESALSSPEHPVVAVVGGAKVSTKIDLLSNLVAKVDQLVIGGGMANTFLAARGYPVGTSLYERDRLDTARDIEGSAARAGCEIVLPEDVVVAKAFEANAHHRVCGLDEVADDEMILDIGPQTETALEARLATARTLLWNGPFGAFELAPFDAGTNAVARAAARLTSAGRLTSVAGGGDTVAALNKARVAGEFTFVSTAGGAFLEWLEGKTLPGVEVLRKL